MFKKQILLTSTLTSITLAGSPDKPCRSTAPMKASRNSIDAILSNPKRSTSGKLDGTRTNADFIGEIDYVNIPGIPLTPVQSIADIVNSNGSSWTPSRKSAGKPQYHLFNPTPNHLLRDLSPDRPDATESPLTVDAGRFALEASLFDYRRDRGVETFTYGSLNFKAGLTHNMDFQTIVDVRSGSQGHWDTFGNLTLRLKYNVFGNDSGDSALALMPFVTAPTRDGEWEGGLIIPWGTDLTDTIGLGLMAEFDYLHDGDDYEFEFLHTAVLGFSLTEKLGAYTEYIGIAKEDHYEAYFAGGMNYAIDENLIMDFGVQTGLNNDSEDFGFFTGFTRRF